jgi:glutathione synthase
MNWLVIIDPQEALKPQTDTSLAVIEAARALEIRVDTATIGELFFDSRAMVMARKVDDGIEVRPLDSYELIFMRKEPPYDLSFHYATHLLSLADTLVVNNPQALRDFNEKLIALNFTRHMPPTLVSSDPKLLSAFVGRYGEAVIKELDSFQGKSVRKIGDTDIHVIDEFTDGGRRPVMVQQFLEAVYDGDKRVMMLGAECIGASLRRPRHGYHANFANSEALAATLSEKEEVILAELGPWLVAHNIYFTGLDLIGGYLTEINITCPTGIKQIGALNGEDLAARTVRYFLSLIKTHSS